MTLIAFEGVACVRGGQRLFEDISFALGAGDALIVSGPNGVGKSSLIRVAAGLLAPAQGRVIGAARRALLAEAHALDPELPLAAALRFWAMIDAVPGPDAAVAAALDQVALSHVASVPVRLLSTGQRRRAALAPMIAAQAPVWLLDEPASGLDTASVDRLAAIVAAHRDGGGAVIIATHQPIALPGAVTIALAPLP